MKTPTFGYSPFLCGCVCGESPAPAPRRMAQPFMERPSSTLGEVTKVVLGGDDRSWEGASRGTRRSVRGWPAAVAVGAPPDVSVRGIQGLAMKS